MAPLSQARIRRALTRYRWTLIVAALMTAIPAVVLPATTAAASGPDAVPDRVASAWRRRPTVPGAISRTSSSCRTVASSPSARKATSARHPRRLVGAGELVTPLDPINSDVDRGLVGIDIAPDYGVQRHRLPAVRLQRRRLAARPQETPGRRQQRVRPPLAAHRRQPGAPTALHERDADHELPGVLGLRHPATTSPTPWAPCSCAGRHAVRRQRRLDVVRPVRPSGRLRPDVLLRPGHQLACGARSSTSTPTATGVASNPFWNGDPSAVRRARSTPTACATRSASR